MFDGLPRPLLFAHRGASRQAPENTLEAFDLAVRLGADVLELDVHLSADGEVVVFHDETLERTTDGSGPIAAKSYTELAGLDAGYHFETAGRFPFRGRQVIIPRLLEVLQAFPDRGFNIELKAGDPSHVAPVLDLLAHVGNERVLLAARDQPVMAALEEAAPGCALGLDIEQMARVIRGAYFGGVPAEFAGRALQIPLRDRRFALGLLPLTSERLLRAAQAAGIAVHLWTINDASVAERWYAAGVDGVMTDDPSPLLEVVERYRTSG